jgi:hypothetical protein
MAFNFDECTRAGNPHFETRKPLRRKLTLQGAFPNHSDPPSQCCEFPSVALIALRIALELCQPEGPVGCWSCCKSTTGVAMPKAAVDKDNSAMLWKHQIWLSGQTRDVQSKPKSQLMERATHSPLGPCMRTTNGRHHSRTRSLIDSIYHTASTLCALRSRNEQADFTAHEFEHGSISQSQSQADDLGLQ